MGADTLFEACVTSLDSAVAAEQGGAGRVELCGWEAEGGTTPTPALIKEVCARLRIPVFALIRPRGGDFVYSAAEADRVVAEIEMAKREGVRGIVAGALNRQGRIDEGTTARFVTAASPLPLTFHRAFDAATDQGMALEALVSLGVTRVLTSGGAATAEQGISMLRKLVEQGRGRIGILAGGKIRAENVVAIVHQSGVREIHARTEARGIVDALKASGRL